MEVEVLIRTAALVLARLWYQCRLQWFFSRISTWWNTKKVVDESTVQEVDF